MAGAFIAAARGGEGQSSTTNSLSITIPAGASAGQQAVLAINSDGTTVTISSGLSGWTLVDGPRRGSGSSSAWLYTRDLQGGDPGSAVTIGLSANVRCGAIMVVESGLNLASLTFSCADDSSATTNYTLPTDTATAHNTALAFFLRRRSGVAANLITIPSPWTSPTNGDYGNAYAAGVNTFGDCGYQDDLSAGSVGGETATTNVSSVGYNYLILIPAATVTVAPTSITTGESLGAPTITTIAQVSPGTVSSLAATGSPSVTTSLSVAPSAIATAESLGEPTIGIEFPLLPDSIPTSEALGDPSVFTLLEVSPGGVESLAALGAPDLAQLFNPQPDGIADGSGIGSPVVRAQRRMLRFYTPYLQRDVPMEGALRATLQYGITVLRMNGEWLAVEHPTPTQENDADRFYRGGHIYELTEAEKDELEAEGYEVEVEYRYVD